MTGSGCQCFRWDVVTTLAANNASLRFDELDCPSAGHQSAGSNAIDAIDVQTSAMKTDD